MKKFEARKRQMIAELRHETRRNCGRYLHWRKAKAELLARLPQAATATDRLEIFDSIDECNSLVDAYREMAKCVIGQRRNYLKAVHQMGRGQGAYSFMREVIGVCKGRREERALEGRE